MKKIWIISLLALSAIGCTAATKADTIAITKADYHKASGYGIVDIHLELPKGTDAVSVAIYNDLWNKLISTMGQDCTYNNVEESLPAYKGTKDLNKLCQYYGSQTLKYWNTTMKEQNDENYEYIRNDTDMSAEDKRNALADTTKYGFDIQLVKQVETPRYVIFTQNVYGYAGGAHGGAYGWGAVTYDRKTGKQLKSFIKPGTLKAIQPLLKRGLKQYFCDNDGSKTMTDAELYDYLMIEGKTIPLPQQYYISPSKAGLVFVYGQYEIASYACGEPSFTIPYAQIKPYLTEEAKKVLGLNATTRK